MRAARKAGCAKQHTSGRVADVYTTEQRRLLLTSRMTQSDRSSRSSTLIEVHVESPIFPCHRFTQVTLTAAVATLVLAGARPVAAADTVKGYTNARRLGGSTSFHQPRLTMPRMAAIFFKVSAATPQRIITFRWAGRQPFKAFLFRVTAICWRAKIAAFVRSPARPRATDRPSSRTRAPPITRSVPRSSDSSRISWASAIG